MKTLVIDENLQSRELLINNLKNIKNIEILGEFESFNLGNIDFSTIDLILFDINSKNCDELVNKIGFLKSQFKNLNFISLSYEINSQMVTKILNAGANDFLLKPIFLNILEASIKKISQNEIKKARTITVFSQKGGVGKTSLITNLAWEIFQQTNDKICILDLNFNSQDVSAFLNTKTEYSLNNVMSNFENLNKDTLLSLIPKYKDSQIYILETKEENIIKESFTTQQITKIINSLKNIFDYIIIDTSNLINESNISIFNYTDLIILLTTTNSASIKNCLKTYELFDKINYANDKIKLIVNRFIESEKSSLEIIKKDIFATIPNNYLTLIDAINLGQNVGEINPQSNIAKAYKRIAQEILKIDFSNLNSKVNYNHGIFNLLRRMGEE